MPPIDPLRALTRECAHQLLAQAARLPPPDVPVSVTAGDDQLTVTVLLAPAGTRSGRPLTSCERDVLAVLEQAPCRLSRPKVIAEMLRRSLFHGESTIGRALTRLTRLGVVRSSRLAPRGYYLPGRSYPLFTDPARCC